MNDGPSFESEIWQYYQQTHPGEVQAIGIDIQNGSISALSSFRDIIGATFPMLLNGSSSTGGNISTLYGGRDDYVVISKQKIVRYHASLNWPFGGRYRRDEIRGAIDSLVTPTTSVVPGHPELRLAAAPNPFRVSATVELSAARPVARAQLEVFDLTGRRLARLHEGALAAGIRSFEWDGRDERGNRAAAGVYLVAADLDGRRLGCRLVRLP